MTKYLLHKGWQIFRASTIAQKLYGICKYYTYQTSALLPDIFLSWFGVAYKEQQVSYG